MIDRRVMGGMMMAGTLWTLGCADDALVQGEIRSGSRIRAVYWVDAEGDRLFKGWFDRERGEECEWTAGPHPRCVPDHAQAWMFADADCTEPVAFVFGTVGACPAAPPPYVGVQGDPCEPGSVGELWALSPEPIAPSVVYAWDPLNSGCTAYATHPESETYYRVTTQVPLEEFVGGRGADFGGGRVKTRTVLGDDGTVAPGAPFDTDLDAICSPIVGASCEPEAMHSSYADDAACARPIGVTSATCAPPGYIAANDSPTTYVRRGALLSDTAGETLSVFDDFAACVPANLVVSAGAAVYRAGDALAPSALVPVTVEHGVGARLSPNWLIAGDHRRALGFYDLDLGAVCYPRAIMPAGLACVPPSFWVSRDRYFADSACTAPLPLIVEIGDAPHGFPALDQPNGCDAIAHAYQRGAARSPSTYFFKSGDACLPGTDLGTVVPTYELGAEVSLAMYATVTSATE
ncbi:MAG: hypothetical protein K8W52_23660 [Deltaproteobacteria bacterium]|nr:hypothetical protein [Deltaproteobacteria bacterium]